MSVLASLYDAGKIIIIYIFIYKLFYILSLKIILFSLIEKSNKEKIENTEYKQISSH